MAPIKPEKGQEMSAPIENETLEQTLRRMRTACAAIKRDIPTVVRIAGAFRDTRLVPGCRYCQRQLEDVQERRWGMCGGCYSDGIAEQASNR